MADETKPNDTLDANVIDPVRREHASDPAPGATIGSAFPATQVQDVIDTIVSGNYKAHAGQLAQDIFAIAEYAMSQIFSSSPTPATLPKTFSTAVNRTVVPTLNNSQACNELQRALDASKAAPGTMMAGTPTNWAALLQFLFGILIKVITPAT